MFSYVFLAYVIIYCYLCIRNNNNNTYNTMNLRVYKDEYKDSHLSSLKETFEVIEETAKVVIISGTEKQLENVMSCMYCTDEEFKAHFPGFLTEDERKEYNTKQIARLKNEMLDTLCRIAENGCIDDDFFHLRKVYFDNFVNNK